MITSDRERKEVRRVTMSSFRTFGVPFYVKRRIWKAFTDEHWDFVNDYNGASGIKEGWVNYYHPVFVWHDYAMQNMDRFKPEGETGNDYAQKVSSDLMKMLEIYKYPLKKSWWQSFKTSVGAYLIGWKIFKR